MDDFETFKSSRLKMDPSSRKMSEHQWQQAYAAYRTTRERVGGGEAESRKKKRRRAKTSAASRGSRGHSRVNDASRLRQAVRDQSAYADLRLTVDFLAWAAIAVVVLAAVAKLFVYMSVPAALVALLGAILQVILVVLLRWLVQVLIDIPDIAIYRCVLESDPRQEPLLDSDSQ